MTSKHFQYLFYTLLSSVLAIYGFTGTLDIKGDSGELPARYFGLLFTIFGIYFFIRFIKEKFNKK